MIAPLALLGLSAVLLWMAFRPEPRRYRVTLNPTRTRPLYQRYWIARTLEEALRRPYSF